MRIVVTGATGNVGTSLLKVLADEPRVDSIVGVARRAPRDTVPKTTWVTADVARDDLEPVMAGADAVVHLAWAIQPARDREETRRVNVDGSARTFRAAAAAGVRVLVHASSSAAYSPGSQERRVDEHWPTDGVVTSFYSRDKVSVERLLDAFEEANPSMRVVRLRPALILKREAGTEIRRLFAGPFLPTPLLRRHLLPVLPSIAGVRTQAVHSDDAARAFAMTVFNDRARGAYNVAAEPVLDASDVVQALGARPVAMSPAIARGAVAAGYVLRLHPTEPGWLDLARSLPLLDSSRITALLGWSPRRSALEALRELLEGMVRGEGAPTPPLDPATSGPLRVRELLTRVGARG